jgi:hypothetical protein
MTVNKLNVGATYNDAAILTLTSTGALYEFFVAGVTDSSGFASNYGKTKSFDA